MALVEGLEISEASEATGVLKVLKWTLVALVALLLFYTGSVVWIDAQLGYNQPQNWSTLVIATLNENGGRHEGVLRLEQIDGENYVAANHWPRAWYYRALGNSTVEVRMPGSEDFEPFVAVLVEGAEEEMLREEYAVSFNFRFRTGFPPRYFLRLDPVRET
jgi:hypothetical protein